MGESAKRHEENSNLIKEIRASMDAAIRNQGASIKTLEIQIGQMSKELQKRGFGSLPSSTETNPRDHVMSISTIVEADTSSIRHIGSNQYAVSTGQNTYSYGASHIDISIPRKEKDLRSFTLPYHIKYVCFDNAFADLGASGCEIYKRIAENVLVGIGKFVFPVDFIILDMPDDVKVPLILGRPFLSTAHAKIDVFKRKIILRVEEEKIIFKSVKPASSLIKRVYMLSLRERMELDLKARPMGETLVKIDNPNITMKEYIRLEEEKARRRGKVYNWEIATYGKIWDNEDVHDLGYVETEFLAIVFNDTLTSEAALSCEPTVSSLNSDEIDFRISFDESTLTS
ncbi:hypothetical protein Tco_1218762 [Tanacetum coccineum]